MSLSILDGFVPAGRAPKYEPLYSVAERRRSMEIPLLVSKMLTKNARLGAQALVRGRLSELDGIVHENGCHKRAAFVVQCAADPELLAEAEALIAAAVRVDRMIDRLLSKMKLPEEERTCREIFDEYGLDLTVSPKMMVLVQDHFVTVGKVHQLAKDGTEIAARIDIAAMCSRLGARRFTAIGLLERMIRHVQTALGESAVAFIQGEGRVVGGVLAERLSDGETQDISEATHGLHARCTPALFEMQTILERGKSLGTLFLLKQYVPRGGEAFGIFYRYDVARLGYVALSEEAAAELDPREAAFVVVGVTPHEKLALKERIAEVGFSEACLANAAVIPQYGSSSVTALPAVEAASDELRRYREMAVALGCSLEDPGLFAIVHTYPNSVGRESVS